MNVLETIIDFITSYISNLYNNYGYFLLKHQNYEDEIGYFKKAIIALSDRLFLY